MSYKLLEDFGDIYGYISSYEGDCLNEESEYYDEQLAEDIDHLLYIVSYNLLSEGYDAEFVIKYLSNESEQTILERYYNTNLNEAALPNEYIEEQLYIISERMGLLRALGGLLTKGGRGLKTAATATRSGAKTAVTKAAGAGVERKVGEKLLRSSDPSRTTKALERLSRSKAAKQGITAPEGALTASQSTKLLKQARAAQALKNVKGAAKTALIGGTGVLTGYLASKLAGRSDGAKTPPTPDAAGTPSGPAAPSAPSTPSSPPVGVPAAPGLPSKDEINKKYQDLRNKAVDDKGNIKDKEADKKAKEYGLEMWAKSHPKLAAAQKERERIRGTAQSDNPLIDDWMRSKMPKNTPSIQSKEVADLGSGHQSLSSNPYAFKGADDKDKTTTKSTTNASNDGKNKTTTKSTTNDDDKKKNGDKTKTESYDAYDLVLDYLFETGQVDSISEAHYIMLEMDSEMIKSIVESY